MTEETRLCLNNIKVEKWIIEVEALTNKEIIVISQLIKEIVLNKLKKNCW